MPLHIFNDLHRYPPGCGGFNALAGANQTPARAPALRLSLRNPIHSIASHDHPMSSNTFKMLLLLNQYYFSPWLVRVVGLVQNVYL